jgi:glycosyltransferase involved in cell wall biosynthesis
VQANYKNFDYIEHPKILMLVPWFDEVPGRWTYFKEMALRLNNAGLKIIAVSPRAKGNKRMENVEGVATYRYSSVYLSQIPLLLVNPIDLLSTLKSIIEREKQIDLIYDATSGVLPSSLIVELFFRLKGVRTPFVIHVHGELKDLKSKGFLSLLFEFYLHTVASRSFAEADKILLAGDKIRPRVLNLGTNPSKLRTVRLGLKNGDRLLHYSNTVSEEKRNNLRTSIRLDKEDFVVGCVGRLSAGKGLDVLLNAIAIDKKAIPTLKVLLVGDGGEKERLKRIASDLGIDDITIFLGHREDVPNLLQLMDVFVNLSRSEAGMSATQLEAMWAGLPSIITPFTDKVDHMVNAIIVPFNDSQAASEAILRLYQNEDLRKLLGENARKKAHDLMTLYTWSGYVSEVIKVLKDLKVC